MELKTNIEIMSPTPPKPPKLTFCCVKMEPIAYLLHVFNFVGSTLFVGFIFLFVADEYGWINGMVKNVGGYWYNYLLKICFCLLLIAASQCLISMAFVAAMQKRPKFLFIYLNVMFLLGITTVVTIGITALVRFEGSWLELGLAVRDRLTIYLTWSCLMLVVTRFCFWLKSAEENERLMQGKFSQVLA